jgi:superfamily II DNA or RNA helicase
MQHALWTPEGAVAVAPSGVELRSYQHEALDGGRGFPGVYGALEEHGSALLVLPTGTGKTTVFARVAERYARRGERVLILAHRSELIEQARRRLLADTGMRESEVGTEQASRRFAPTDQVVVGSVATLRGKRLERIPPDYFGLIVTDEAHHARAAGYEAIYRHLAAARRLGVTATPDRHDGKGLGKWHQALGYVYEIRDAIADRFLVPIRARMIFVDAIDLSQVRKHHGDLDENEVAAVMERAEALHGVAKPTVELAGERPTLIFATRVTHARALADVLNGYAPGQARSIDGTSPDELRRQTLADFEARRFRYLVNVALFTEGVDIPLTSCVVTARPTESRGLYCQMVGRGTRLLGATWEESLRRGKEDLLVLDMCGNSGRHKLVCALDILDSSTDEAVRRRAVKRAQEEEIEVGEALERAAREEVLQQRLDLVASVRYRVVDVQDQFSLLGVRPRAGRWGGVGATEKQLAMLERAKVKGFDKLDRGQASDVIDALFKRRSAGLCTLPMASVLLRQGLNPDLPMQRASEVIQALRDNNWKLPPALLADESLILSQEALTKKREQMGA